jgi:hypothetical protein
MSIVTAIGTTRRLQALVAIGYNQESLCELTGIDRSAMSLLVRGRIPRIRTATADAVIAVYDSISMTPGPSHPARARAHRKGWAPPLAWDDDHIDDPDARPDIGKHHRVTYVERYRELRELGYNDLEIAKKFGVQARGLKRQLDRYGLPVSELLVAEAGRERYAEAVS